MCASCTPNSGIVTLIQKIRGSNINADWISGHVLNCRVYIQIVKLPVWKSDLPSRFTPGLTLREGYYGWAAARGHTRGFANISDCLTN